MAREHEGVHVTAAPDAGPAPESGQNTGISGTRHMAVDGDQPQTAHVNAEIARPAAAGPGVLEGTVVTGTPATTRTPAITGTPADALAVSPRAVDPYPAVPEDSHEAGHGGRASHGPGGGSYDETSGIVYEVSPSGGFAALGLDPDARPSSSGDAPAAAIPAQAPPIVISGLSQSRTLPQGSGPAAQPAWNQTTASVHQAAEDEERGGLLGMLGGLLSASGGEDPDEESGRPSLTRARDLPLDQKLRIWRIRALIVVGVGVVFSIISDWEVGLTLAIVAGIADTIYRARTVESHYWKQPGTVDRASWRAQRRTQRQLARMGRAGYVALHRRPIPDSVEVIDHLVVGPTGVYAIDSEKWDKELPIRTRNGKQLWLGPQSMKDRLEHARWEAGQASELLSQALGSEVVVRPALAIYGPKIPWDIAIIREVDVFSGDRLKKYLQRRSRDKKLPRLSEAEIAKIRTAATAVLPIAAGRTAAPVA